MNCLPHLSLGVLLAGAAAFGCSGNGATNPAGTGGSGGAAGGASGSGGGGSGGSGAFMVNAPCNAPSDYVTGTTINFGGTVGYNYDPQCLKVAAGTTVTFSGDFSSHPLVPSAMRGNTTGNPIVNMSDGTTAAPFTFPTPGFYAYLCNFHGNDDGTSMAGVIWVQ